MGHSRSEDSTNQEISLVLRNPKSQHASNGQYSNKPSYLSRAVLLILSSHLQLGFQVVSPLVGFTTKTLHAFLTFPMCAMCPDDHSNNMFLDGIQIIRG